MKVLALDISKHAGWVIASEEGEILETGNFNDPEDADDSATEDKSEVTE